MLNFFKPKTTAILTNKRKSPETSAPAGKANGSAAKSAKRQPLQQRQATAAAPIPSPAAFPGPQHKSEQSAPMVIDLDDSIDTHADVNASAASLPSSNHNLPPHAETGIDSPEGAFKGSGPKSAPALQQNDEEAAECVLPSDTKAGPVGQQNGYHSGAANGDQTAGSSESAEAGVLDGSRAMKMAQLGPPLPNGVSRQQADSLIAMGFSQAQASRALLVTQGDLPRAINWILQS